MKNILRALLLILIISAQSLAQLYTIESSNPGYFSVNDIDYPKNHFGFKYDGSLTDSTQRNFTLYNIHTQENLIVSRYFDEVAGVSSWEELTQLLKDVGAIKSNDVLLQDATTPLIIANMSTEEAATTLSVQGSINDYTITVTDTAGFGESGGYLSVFSVPDNRFYLANSLGKTGFVISVDTPLDFDFPVGSFVTTGNRNMNVDGSTVPVIYGLRNTEQAIGSAFDITRIIFSCFASSTVDLSKFGDIADGLTKGIVFRKVDGVFRNVFNAKTNGELKNIMFDFDIQAAAGNQQDGFTGRLTFAGQNKMGVVLRIQPGEDVQMIIQDDLTTLPRFWVICEGHTVE